MKLKKELKNVNYMVTKITKIIKIININTMIMHMDMKKEHMVIMVMEM